MVETQSGLQWSSWIKRAGRHYSLLFLMLLTGACMAAPAGPVAVGTDSGPGDEQLAVEHLTEFFVHLNKAEFDQAAELYGGSYETLLEYNPSINPEDSESLFKAACFVNGFQCLPVRKVVLLEHPEPNDFILVAEFIKDGQLFVRGQCCGGDAGKESPPASQFLYRVRKDPDGTFSVLDLPVYVP